MTAAPPPISLFQFRNRRISKVAGFETGFTERALILLATWGFNTSARSPNPPPPQDERSPSVPLENVGLFQWGPTIVRVSNYSEGI